MKILLRKKSRSNKIQNESLFLFFLFQILLKPSLRYLRSLQEVGPDLQRMWRTFVNVLAVSSRFVEKSSSRRSSGGQPYSFLVESLERRYDELDHMKVLEDFECEAARVEGKSILNIFEHGFF